MAYRCLHAYSRHLHRAFITNLAISEVGLILEERHERFVTPILTMLFLQRTYHKGSALACLNPSEFNHVLNVVRTLCSKPLKGFEKPAKNRKNENKESEPKPESSSEPDKDTKPPQAAKKAKEFKFEKDFNFSFGGGGEGNNSAYLKMGFAVAATLLGVLAVNEMKYKEVTWKEFINNYLARGSVEKLAVVNKKWVRVYLHPGSKADSNVLWFNIGSVDTFERNLENIQLEMNLESANFVPVVYKSEWDGSVYLF